MKRWVARAVVLFMVAIGLNACGNDGSSGFAPSTSTTSVAPDPKVSPGHVWAWGSNFSGALGNATTTDSDVPVPVSNISGIMAVSAGDDYSLALDSGGRTWAWGNNSHGQLGNGTTTNSNVPIQVNNLKHIVKIAAGKGSQSLALDSGGRVWAWGDNSSGQLGTGTNTDSLKPVQISNLKRIAAIAAGDSFSLALDKSGNVWAWGDNSLGQLCNGTNTDSLKPVQVSNLKHIAAIAAGAAFTLALDSGGHVWACGFNFNGQLGNGTHNDISVNANSNIPVQVLNLSGIKAIAAGGAHGLAVDSSGGGWGWGYGEYGQLGNGNIFEINDTPGPILNVSGITAIAAGTGHSLVLDSSGNVWAFGDDFMGQLGIGPRPEPTPDVLVPVQLTNIAGVSAISAGRFHSLAIKAGP